MGRKFRGVLPAGSDRVVAAEEVRQGMWMRDPVTGEWANVAGFERPRRMVCFGGSAPTPPVVVSLRRHGAREFAPGDPVTVRVPGEIDRAAPDVHTPGRSASMTADTSVSDRPEERM